jgi:hypothetical protein
MEMQDTASCFEGGKAPLFTNALVTASEMTDALPEEDMLLHASSKLDFISLNLSTVSL